MRSSLALVFLVVGCGHAAIDREAEHEITEASTRAQAQIVYSSCQGSAMGPNCGLIMRHAMTEDFRTKFRDRACLTRTSEECEATFQKMIDAELDRRYFAADWKGVAQECDLSPPKCDDPTVYERLLVASHNRAIQSGFDKEEAEINVRRQRRHAEESERTLRMIDTALYLLHDGPKCRSYPSAFREGVTLTTCTR